MRAVQIMARLENCSAVLIDDRVKTERWARRNATGESKYDPSVHWEDECATLQTTVESLLDVCKQSKFVVANFRREQID